jgi:hypothetical protein
MCSLILCEYAVRSNLHDTMTTEWESMVSLLTCNDQWVEEIQEMRSESLARELYSLIRALTQAILDVIERHGL